MMILSNGVFSTSDNEGLPGEAFCGGEEWD
jgi:hypothetical protein